MDTHPLRYSNPRGLIRSHIAQQQTTLHPASAQQQTGFYPAITEQQTTLHPVIEQQKTIHHPAIKRQKTTLHSVIEQQKTIHHPALAAASTTAEPPKTADRASKKRRWSRIVAIAVIAALALMIFFIWHSAAPATASSASVQQSQSTLATTTQSGATAPSSTDGSISVYVTGAVKHPGVYTLDANARVYQLLQAAGGPLPNANLVALNLAAKLTDGQNVYVIAIGETPPTYVGGVPGLASSGSGGDSSTTTAAPGLPVNINTASVEDLRLGLHVSSTTAQKIVDYRTQYGPYTSVDQLAQVVSRSIYDRIKNMVTV